MKPLASCKQLTKPGGSSYRFPGLVAQYYWLLAIDYMLHQVFVLLVTIERGLLSVVTSLPWAVLSYICSLVLAMYMYSARDGVPIVSKQVRRVRRP